MFTPFRDFESTFRTFGSLSREMDRLFDVRGNEAAPQATNWPLLNVRESDDAFVLQLEVPGIAENDLSITVENDTVELKGERKPDVFEGYTALAREREPFRFARKFKLATRLDGERVEATLKHGVLTLHLPKAASAKARQITVKST